MAPARVDGLVLPNERTRVVVAVVVGVGAAAATTWFAPWQLTVLVGWDVTAATLLIWVWISVGRLDNKQTALVATAEDNTRQGTRVLLVGAAVASLVGAALALSKTKSESGTIAVVVTTTAILTVVLSWALVHTLFALRYARLYYSGRDGGIDFKNDDPPDFVDFAYVAFTVGMTFQVSDTDIQLRPIRRAVLRHALISYLFGVVIIAVTINVIAGFVK